MTAMTRTDVADLAVGTRALLADPGRESHGYDPGTVRSVLYTHDQEPIEPYLFPFARLWFTQSISQLARTVEPPFDHAVTWSASISVRW